MDAYDRCTNLKKILLILLPSMVVAENFSDHPRKKQLLISPSRDCYSVPSFRHTRNIELLYMHRIVSVAEPIIYWQLESGEHDDKFNMCVSLQNPVVVF
jgi:hypothetical protein